MSKQSFSQELSQATKSLADLSSLKAGDMRFDSMWSRAGRMLAVLGVII